MVARAGAALRMVGAVPCVLNVIDAPLDGEHTIMQCGGYLLYLTKMDSWI
jgi:hypothetical protein